MTRLDRENRSCGAELFSHSTRRNGTGVAVVSDSELIEQAVRGDLDSFGELVERYQDRLYAAMFHRLGNREDAEDAVQDAFIRAYRKLATFDGRSGFYTWLFRIAHNAAISRRRRRRPRVSLDEQRDATGSEPASEGPPPQETAMRREQVQQVREAIDQLPDDQRDILILRELEGFCYEEIGHILDLAPGTVRSRLHRARTRLRELLDRMIGQPSME